MLIDKTSACRHHPLPHLHVQVAAPALLADRRIPAVGQRAAAAVAQACGETPGRQRGWRLASAAWLCGSGHCDAAARHPSSLQAAATTPAARAAAASSSKLAPPPPPPTGDVVLVAAEVLRLGLGPEAAVAVHDDLPDDLQGGSGRGQ